MKILFELFDFFELKFFFEFIIISPTDLFFLCRFLIKTLFADFEFLLLKMLYEFFFSVMNVCEIPMSKKPSFCFILSEKYKFSF